MSTNNPTANNHFVQQAYLRRWSDDGKTIQEYKIVVPHERYPDWQPVAIRRAASMRNLYTVDLPGHELDHYEKWFNEDVEQPAAEALGKAVEDKPLTKRDLEHLVRYAFAQSVRTPTDYIEHQKKANEIIPGLLASSLEEAVKKRARGIVAPPSQTPRDEALPLVVSPDTMPDGTLAIKAEFSIGPASWLSSRKRMIRTYPPRFMRHTWQVLSAHESMEWFTSDHPVLRLGYMGDQPHGLRAGWMQPGADIIMPLSPRHLLHTQVGSKKKHPTALSREKTFEILMLLAKNARQSIYARTPIPRMRWLQERVVNLEAWENERKLWG